MCRACVEEVSGDFLEGSSDNLSERWSFKSGNMKVMDYSVEYGG